MKEMVYSAERKNEILDTGFCFGLLYYILNLGTHPTAYIKIPKDHRLYGKSESEIYKEVDIDVHGGITYAEEGIYADNKQVEGWFIGWDYAHCYDYMGYEEKLPVDLNSGGKKWTTKEIYKEVRAACYQIQKAKEEKENGNKE